MAFGSIIMTAYGPIRDYRSYCGNSDMFVHGLLGEPRNLSDKAYQERAEFFHSFLDEQGEKK